MVRPRRRFQNIVLMSKGSLSRFSPSVSITLPPSRAARARQMVQRIVGVANLLARKKVILRGDFAVVLRRRVVVLDILSHGTRVAVVASC